MLDRGDILNRCILTPLSSPPPFSQRLTMQYQATPRRRIVLRIEINIKFASVIKKGHFANLVSWETQTTNPFFLDVIFFRRVPFSHLFPSNFLYPSPGRREKRKRRRETRGNPLFDPLPSSSSSGFEETKRSSRKKIAEKNNFSVAFKFLPLLQKSNELHNFSIF